MPTAPLYTTSSTNPGLMAEIWHGLLSAWSSGNPLYGTKVVDEDFLFDLDDAVTGTTSEASSDGWTGMDSVAAGGTYAVTVIPGTDGRGYLRIDNNGTTTDYGVEAQRAPIAIPLPSHATVARGVVAYQTRIDNVDADVVGAGLTDAATTVPVMGSGNDLADVAYIGFQITNAGDLYFKTKSAAAGTADSALVIAAANFTPTAVHVLGFRVNKDLTVEIAVDGVRYDAAAKSIDPASLPTTLLAPRFSATVGNGSTAPTCDIDSVQVFVAN